MESILRRIRRVAVAALVLAATAAALPAHAGYRITVIDYPGALCTTAWGINAAGLVVGNAAFSADCSGVSFAFVYDLRRGTFTVLPTVAGATATSGIGINDAGAITGSFGDGTSTTDTGLVLDRGAFAFFAHPGWPLTQGRAIGNSGIVTGYSADSAGNTVAFIFDPRSKAFTDIPFAGAIGLNVAQGINGRGEVVGSTVLGANVAYAGAPQGAYAFLRGRDGAITLFWVNGGRTRARGITESGRIAGFYTDPATGIARGFVTTLGTRGGFQSLSVPAEELIDVPGATLTVPEGIDDSGRVAGQWTDAGGNTHGFVAAPLRH